MSPSSEVLQAGDLLKYSNFKNFHKNAHHGSNYTSCVGHTFYKSCTIMKSVYTLPEGVYDVTYEALTAPLFSM